MSPQYQKRSQHTTTIMKITASLLLSGLMLATASPARQAKAVSGQPTKTIAELAIATPQLSTLLAAVKAAGLVDTLSGPGPFTVFAPTNAAFAKVPSDALAALLQDKEALTAVLLRHVVPAEIR